MESRCHIYLEKYSKQVNIEAGVTIDIARRGIFPAASKYGAELARGFGGIFTGRGKLRG
jgi:glutamine synthetase